LGVVSDSILPLVATVKVCVGLSVDINGLVRSLKLPKSFCAAFA
jgi:hypothetical protein